MSGDCWPTDIQTLLLRAALVDGPSAKASLEAWRSRADIDRLDRGSRRLLALIAPRLADDDPLAALAHEERTRAETRNADLLRVAAHVIRQLSDVSVETVLLKGMALVARGYLTTADRPMADCDILVRESQALAARNLLIARGWHSDDRLDAGTVAVRHSVNFRNADGRQIDLHWHVLAECCEPGADSDFWRAAAPATLHGEGTRTLCAEDMVLHACVHGLQWSIVPPVRWVVDAAAVIRAAGAAFDWKRVADQAERRMLVLQVHDTLRFLRDAIEIAVPEDVLSRLARAPLLPWTRAEYRVKTSQRSRTRQLLYHWYVNRRLNASRSALGAAVRFPTYLRQRP
jgi:hypothetical protein